VTGLNIYNQKRQDFEFRPGPVLSQVLLADEINRATPRTQSSLLEAMQERQITVDGETYPLPRPFIVIATQNPIELEGTFPLPEAQVDRFLMQLRLGYPSAEEEDEILLRYQRHDPLMDLRPVATTEDVLELQRRVQDIHVSTDVRNYTLQVTRTTREHEAVDLGVSPRGTLALFKASQALAALRGRDYVIPSDVQYLCPPILAHRIHISPRIRLRGRTPAQVVAEITDTVPVPVVE
jgi:MoxR-like ATPase